MGKGAISFVFIFFCFGLSLKAQEHFFTKKGRVSFFSEALIEDIKADNDQVLSIVDTATHKIAIQLLMRSFVFEKALMQEHFNENYVESHEYPKAKFAGRISNFEDLNKEDAETEIVGELTFHGKSKKISTKANVSIGVDEIVLKGDFNIEVADFNIKIPSIVRNNIAKTIKVSFELHHKPYDLKQ